jgi:O-antigen biosynthesis alpha-1,3-mannosyltransferase
LKHDVGKFEQKFLLCSIGKRLCCKPSYQQMKIGFNTTFLHTHGGITTYAVNLINELVRLAPEHAFYLYTSSSAKKLKATQDLFPPHPNVVYRNSIPSRKIFGNWATRLMDPYREVLLKKLSTEVSLMHCVDPAFYTEGTQNAVVTIHDLFPLYNVPWIDAGVAESVQRKIAPIINQSKLIITPSEFVKQDIVTRLHVALEKIWVTPEAASPFFRQVNVEWSRLEKYGITEKTQFLLHVGRIDPRKNTMGMIESYKRLPPTLKKQVALIIFTNGASEEFESFKDAFNSHAAGENIRYFTGLKTEDLLHLYNAALALVLVSFGEGFGLPVLEAMQCGCPVITSNNTALPEVAGDAALLVPSDDYTAIANAMRRLCEDEPLRKTLSEKSLERAKLFSWKRCAELTLEGYKKVIHV